MDALASLQNEVSRWEDMRMLAEETRRALDKQQREFECTIREKLSQFASDARESRRTRTQEDSIQEVKRNEHANEQQKKMQHTIETLIRQQKAGHDITRNEIHEKIERR